MSFVARGKRDRSKVGEGGGDSIPSYIVGLFVIVNRKHTGEHMEQNERKSSCELMQSFPGRHVDVASITIPFSRLDRSISFSSYE